MLVDRALPTKVRADHPDGHTSRRARDLSLYLRVYGTDEVYNLLW